MSLLMPAHATRATPWRQRFRGGTRADRMFSSVDTSVPPTIAELNIVPDAPLIARMEGALVAARTADLAAARHSLALGRFLVRTESVASSKIERITARTDDFARALAGARFNASAVSMVSATLALTRMIDDVGRTRLITADALLEAHRLLMRDDPHEADYAGRVRDMQNWIGGSDYSPRNALFVPPPPELVPDLIADLLRYANRDDVPVLVQCAVAHAQFESIHPFTDGNGRIGRALINAILRRRGLTEVGVIPIASGLLALRDEYFSLLGAYRRGDAGGMVDLLTTSTQVAADEMRLSLERLSRLPDEWRREVNPRHGSVGAAILAGLFDHPILSTSDAERLGGASARATYDAIAKLESSGIIHEITGRKRDRVWVATEMMAELDDLSSRIEASVRVATRTVAGDSR